MPRIYEEDYDYDESSSEGSYEISEVTISSVKYTRDTKVSEETSASNSIQVRIAASPLFFTSCHSQDEKHNAPHKTMATTNGRKREREEDEDEDVMNGHDSKRTRHLESCQWCQLAAFENFEKYPVTITNDVDNVALPASFQFIQNSIYREGVEPAEDAFRTGCECDDRKDCLQTGCTCTDDVEKVPGTKVAAHRMQYQIVAPYRDCLKDAFLDQRQAIYECNEKCACGPSCWNRVVEKGRTVPLEIFKTSDNRGWGLRCSKNLLKGQFIDLYVGEVITAEEAQRRRQESNIEKKKDVYLFALDKFTDPDSLDERLIGPPLEVDGEFFSGPTRFMNHSCNPNSRIFARVGDSADKHLHDLAFFAIRDIPAHTELTFDYVDGKDDDLEEDEEGEVIPCLCGSDNCRGWLW